MYLRAHQYMHRCGVVWMLLVLRTKDVVMSLFFVVCCFSMLVVVVWKRETLGYGDGIGRLAMNGLNCVQRIFQLLSSFDCNTFYSNSNFTGWFLLMRMLRAEECV